jgi:hypothetical protein
MGQIGKERATGLIVLIVGILIIPFAVQLPSPNLVSDDPGPAIFPIIAAVMMIINGVILVVKNKSKEGEKKKHYFNKEEWTRFGLLLFLYVGYFFLLWLIGFILATFIMMFVTCTMFSKGKNVAGWKRVLFAVIVTAGIYCAFFKGLGLRLPLGTIIRLDL